MTKIEVRAAMVNPIVEALCVKDTLSGYISVSSYQIFG